MTCLTTAEAHTARAAAPAASWVGELRLLVDAQVIGSLKKKRTLTGADGITRTRAEKGRRQLATTVGRVEASRIAYRAPKAAALHPADAQLALPAAVHSHPLRRAVVHEAAAGSLRQARDALIRSTGVHLGTRQLMEITTGAAVDVAAFYALRDHTARTAAAAGRHQETEPRSTGQ